MADGPPPRPRRTSRNAITAVVAFAYLVLLVVVATGNWLTADQDRQAVLQAAERSAAATALLLAEHADRTIHAIDLHMHSIAETFRTEDGSLEEFIGRARLLAEAGDGRLPQALGFAITDEAGIVRHAANPATIGLDFGRHPQFVRMASDRSVRYVHSRPMLMPQIGQRAVVMAWPLRDRAGRFRGAVGTMLNPEYFATVMSRLAASGPAHAAAIAYPDGTIVAAHGLDAPDARGEWSLPVGLPLPPDESAAVATSGFDGTLGDRSSRWIIATAAIPGFGQAAMVAIDCDEVLAPVIERALLLAAFSVGGLLVLALLSWIVLRSYRAQARALAAAQAASQAKTAFIGVLSHEIRTPMNAILGMNRLLRTAPDLPERLRYHTQVIRSAGDNLVTVLNDMLDMSKIEAGQLELERADFDLEQLADEVVALHRPTAAEKGLELRVAPIPSPPMLRGDAVRIQQILGNLVGNAIKFTNAGRIDVEFAIAGAARGDPAGRPAVLHMEVRDTGVGIPADRRGRLFQPFSQADSSTTRRFGGTGLGLAICRRLTEMMDGTIEFDSEEGRGSCFRVRLMLTTAETRRQRDGAAPAARLRPLSILVAEDSALNQELMREALQAVGHRVTIAESGTAAVTEAESGRHDLILMDVRMPGMDGVEATRRIRAGGGAGAGLPIIGLTADATEAQREECLAAGMEAVLVKPVDFARLWQLAASLVPAADAAAAPATATATTSVAEAMQAAAAAEMEVAMVTSDAFSGMPLVDHKRRERTAAAIGAEQEGRLFAAMLDSVAETIAVLAKPGLPLDDVRAAAHRAKGAAANLGSPRIAGLLEAIDTAARAGTPPSGADIERLRETLEAVSATV
ncbi:hypothetical protein STAQ_41350 [Allostella sp. ATCC 35155]|nr:hypothetical protein STAQ_41350 [Stella sp. ATCC 35155]